MVQDLIPELIKIDDNNHKHLKFDLLARVLSGEIILDTMKKYIDFFPSFEHLTHQNEENKESSESKKHLK